MLKVKYWIVNYFRRLKIRVKKQAIIGNNVYIGRGCFFEGMNYLMGNDTLRSTYMGEYSYVNEYVELEKCKVGKYTCIGPRVKIIAGKHPTAQWVSIHPAFYSLRGQSGSTFVNREKFCEYSEAKYDGYVTSIGNDVWIGADVRIMEGIKIGDGAIIAAGAIVTKNVPEYAIVGGIPAKLIKYRFEKAEIDFLKKLEWWNKDKTWIKAHAEYFEDIRTLMKEVES